jgi:transcriptional regulator with XRE-family HTH domain
LPEKRVFSPDELLGALKRYLAESGDTEAAVASRIGVNHHTLRRWLSDKQSPKKGKLALAAAFLRHAGSCKRSPAVDVSRFGSVTRLLNRPQRERLSLFKVWIPVINKIQPAFVTGAQERFVFLRTSGC